MATWKEVEASAPEFAAAVRARFDAHRHKLLATLRKDGAPRISGIEASFINGDLWLGMMAGSRKALDLRRDPRLALHSASEDPPDDPGQWPGDAKIMGRAVEVTDPATIQAIQEAEGGAGGQEPPESHLFRVEIDEVVLTRPGVPPDHLVIELWRAGRGLKRMERR